MISAQEFLWTFVVPGVIAAAAGFVARWPLRSRPNAGRLFLAIGLAGAFAVGCWQLELFQFNRIPGRHWIPIAGMGALVIGVLDACIPGRMGRIVQAALFVAFLPAAAFFVAPDYPAQREFRWTVVTCLAVVMGVSWCTAEWTARRRKEGFPWLLGPIVIAVFAAMTTGLSYSLTSAFFCGLLGAVLTGAATFTRPVQSRAARPAVALFSVALPGMLYAHYVGDASAFQGENLLRDVSLGIVVFAPWLLPLYVTRLPRLTAGTARHGFVVTTIIMVLMAASTVMMSVLTSE